MSEATTFTIETAESADNTLEATTAEESKTETVATKEVTPDKPNKKGRAQVRIEGLSHDKRELSKKNDELQQRIEELEGKDIKLPTKPDIDDFEDIDDYEKKMDEYDDKVTEIEVRHEKKKDKPSVNHEFQAVLDEIESKFDDARDKYDDFDEVVKSTEGVVFTASMVEAMNDMDNSGDIAYALGKDVEESKRISKLSPNKQIMAMVKLSDKINKAPEPKKQTKAAEPIVPIEGAGGNRERGIADAENFKEYASIRKKDTQSKNGW